MVKIGPHIREALGKLVRDTFMAYMHQVIEVSVNPKNFTPWEVMPEWEKELDRRIGEEVYLQLLTESQLNNLNAGAELEQARVQLAGCLIAAEGGTSPEVVATEGMYGWSFAYQRVLELRLAYNELAPTGIKTAQVPPEDLRAMLREAAVEVPIGRYKHVESGEVVMVSGIRLDEASLTPRIEYDHCGVPFSRTVPRFKERFKPYESHAKEVRPDRPSGHGVVLSCGSVRTDEAPI